MKKSMNKRMTKSYSSAENNGLLEGYVKGKRFLPHGEVSTTNDKGQRILLGQYLNGRPNSKWFRWYEDGTLCSEHQYAFGRFIGTSKQYWANGVLARDCKYEKGSHDYEEKIYNKKGGEEKHKVYKKGKLVKAKIRIRDKWLDFDSDLFKLSFPWLIIAEKLCYLNQDNYLRCKTPYQVWHDLNTFLDPETVESILNQLNDLYADLGLDTQNTVLTSCSGTFVATQINTASPNVRSSPTVRNADDHNASFTQQESDDISNACLSAVKAAVADGGIDSFTNNDQGTRDAVNTIDEVVSNCADNDNSMISLGGVVLRGLTTAGKAIYKSCKSNSEICAGLAGFVGGMSTDVFTYVFDDGWSEEADHGSFTRSNDGSGAIRDTYEDKTVTDSPASPGDSNAGGRTVETKYSDGTVRIEYYDAAGKLIRVVDTDDGNVVYDSDTDLIQGTEDSGTNSDDLDIEMDEPTVTTGGGSSGTPSAGQPVDETGMSECEQMAAWWAGKKAYCEQSDWKTYDCQEILRLFTGCADPALVYPTPDGNGVVCPQKSGITMEEVRQRDCESKSMIMIPSGFGVELCASREDLAFPERDICSDPSAQCLPDSMVPDESLNTQDPFINSRRESQLSKQARRGYSRTTVTSAFDSYQSVKEIGEEDFEKSINAKDDKTHFVVFASKACGPCHKVLNVFNDESQNHKNATFNRVDFSQNPDLSQRFEIRYTPTILVFKNGEMVSQRRVGAASRDVLVEYINRAFNLQRDKGEKVGQSLISKTELGEN